MVECGVISDDGGIKLRARGIEEYIRRGGKFPEDFTVLFFENASRSEIRAALDVANLAISFSQEDSTERIMGPTYEDTICSVYDGTSEKPLRFHSRMINPFFDSYALMHQGKFKTTNSH